MCVQKLAYALYSMCVKLGDSTEKDNWSNYSTQDSYPYSFLSSQSRVSW